MFRVEKSSQHQQRIGRRFYLASLFFALGSRFLSSGRSVWPGKVIHIYARAHFAVNEKMQLALWHVRRNIVMTCDCISEHAIASHARCTLCVDSHVFSFSPPCVAWRPRRSPQGGAGVLFYFQQKIRFCFDKLWSLTISLFSRQWELKHDKSDADMITKRQNSCAIDRNIVLHMQVQDLHKF